MSLSSCNTWAACTEWAWTRVAQAHLAWAAYTVGAGAHVSFSSCLRFRLSWRFESFRFRLKLSRSLSFQTWLVHGQNSSLCLRGCAQGKISPLCCTFFPPPKNIDLLFGKKTLAERSWRGLRSQTSSHSLTRSLRQRHFPPHALFTLPKLAACCSCLGLVSPALWRALKIEPECSLQQCFLSKPFDGNPSCLQFEDVPTPPPTLFWGGGILHVLLLGVQN